MVILDYSKDKIMHMKSVMTSLKLEVRAHNIPFDPFAIAKYKDIEVAFIHIDNPYAITIPDPITNKLTIYISNEVDRYSQKFLCYHELGHILCEGCYNVHLFDHTIDHESEFIANIFASCFLPFSEGFDFFNGATVEEFNKFIVSKIRKKTT